MAATEEPQHPHTAPSIAELVARSHTAVWGAENALAAVEVIAVFDHDFQAHVLVQEWDHTAATPRWSYRLWFRDGDTIVPVHGFDDAVWPNPPLVDAATIASDWRQLQAAACCAER
jgi:hypothetical protein